MMLTKRPTDGVASAQRVPEPDPLLSIFSIPHPTQFLFENHWVAGKFRVLPDISGIPRHDWVLGIPQ